MSDKKTALARIKVLVDKFQKQISYYKSNSYKEDQLRVDFIDPFWEALGWDVKNEKDLPQTYREVIYEDRLKSREEDNITTKEPDYAFTVNGERKFFLEVKKPAVMVKNDPKPAIQARLYGWNARLPISLVSDFEELAVYDCNKYAKAHDKAGDSRLKYIEFTNYEKEFDFIYDTFSRDAVFDGSLDKYVKIDKKGSETVDAEFLKQMNHWRKLLAEGIAQKNPEISEEEIRFAVQMLLDRIIFLRICEDREIEKYKTLQSIARSTKGIHTQLFSYFKTAAAKYNSNLFEFQTKDTFTENLNVPDVTWQIIILNLYFPNSPFLFKFIPADVLGNVYEQFLGKQIILKGRLTREIDIDYKPEVRKAGGVYYTPQYIVSYIIQNTIGKLLQGKTPEEVDKLKIVDPSCGSGSFLIQAYQYLLGWYQDYYYKIAQKQAKIRLNAKTATKNEKLIQTKVVGTLIHPDGKLTTAEKKRILLNSIYGVDIDEQAVEVTKLNLLLKALEGETNATIEEQTKVRKQKVLADLDKNIRAGNSLIGKDYKDKSVKPFDWEAAFPDVFRQGGFDAVIGNPPYVRMQTMEKNNTDYYTQKYESAKYGNYDLYVVFIEKGFNILNKNGNLGMILPHKFFQTQYGEGIRNFILNNQSLYQINDFTTNQIFNDATTYTCLLFLNKNIAKNYTFNYQRIELGNDVEKALQSNISVILKYDTLKNPKWNFYENDKGKLIDTLKLNNLNLGHFTKKIFKGSSTGNDDIYILELINEKKDLYELFSKQLNKIVTIEKKILKPFVYASDIKNYVEIKTNYFLLFPYEQFKNNVKLLPIDSFKKEYPFAFKYLFELKDVLQKRKIETNDNDFYKFSAGRSLYEYNQIKIMIPDIINCPNSSIDLKGNLFHGPAIHSVVLNDNAVNYNSLYFLALINSKVTWFFIKNTSTALRNNYYRLIPEFLNPIPIPEIKNKTEKALHDKMVGLVEEMLDLQKQVRQPSLLPNKHAEIEDDIRYTDAQIDKCVYELYGLTPEEIKIVES